MSIVVSHGGPNTPNGNVEGPTSAWLAPGIRKRTPDAIAQKRPMTSRSGPNAYSTASRSNASGSPGLS